MLGAPWGWTETKKAARWLTADTSEVARAVCARALADVGVCENPPGSNRSPYLDECNTRAGVPQGIIAAGKAWWCASVAGRWWADCGLPTPRGYASCDAWLTWDASAKTEAWLDREPTPGALILYGAKSLTGPVVYAGARHDAVHIGVVIRVAPYLVTVEGNAAWGGTFTHNGEAVVARRVDARQPNILGYIPVTYGTERGA